MKLIDLDDRRLNVVDVGRGSPLVLVHGFPLDHSMWSGQIDELSVDFRVIAPDLRGFGRSTGGVGERLTMDQLADDIAALLDVLQIDEPVTYCGLSMGGYIGWQFFRRHRDRLGKLIQCDTKSRADTDEARETRLKAASLVLRQGVGPLVATMLPKLFSEATVQNQPHLVEATRPVMEATLPQTVAASQRGMAARPDVTSMLGVIEVPALVLCGEQDTISPPDEMRSIAEAIPRAQYVEIAGAGHMAPLEDPAAVNQAIRKFLET